MVKNVRNFHCFLRDFRGQFGAVRDGRSEASNSQHTCCRVFGVTHIELGNKMIFRALFPPHPGSFLRLPEVTLSALSLRRRSAIWVTEEVAAWAIPRRERVFLPLFCRPPLRRNPPPPGRVCVCSPVPAGLNAAGL